MDGSRFDALVRSCLGSRRSLLAGGLGLGMLWRPMISGAKNKRKKHKNRTPRATPNELGCLNVDDPCTSNDQCCSGICDGTKGKKTCRAHDTGNCEAGSDLEACGGISTIDCTTNGGVGGICGTTTGNAGYCLYTADCYPCRADLECQRAAGGFFGPTAACIKCAACAETGGTACALAEISGPAMLGETA